MSQSQNSVLNAGYNFGTKAAVKKLLYWSLLLFQGRTHQSTSKFSALQWPAKPFPLVVIGTLLVSLALVTREGAPEGWYFYITRCLAPVRVSGKCHWDHTAQCAVHLELNTWLSVTPKLVWYEAVGKGSSHGLPEVSATLSLPSVVDVVVFWPQDNFCNSADSVENKLLTNVTIS